MVMVMVMDYQTHFLYAYLNVLNKLFIYACSQIWSISKFSLTHFSLQAQSDL